MTDYSAELLAIGNAGTHLDALCNAYKDDPAFKLNDLHDLFMSDTMQVPDCEHEMKPGSPLLNNITIFFEYRSKIHKFSILMTWYCQYTVQDDFTWLRINSIADYQLTRYLKPKWQK